MEKLVISKLDLETQVNSEHLSCRVSPEVRKFYEEVATATNRSLAEVVRLVVTWAMDKIEFKGGESNE